MIWPLGNRRKTVHLVTSDTFDALYLAPLTLVPVMFFIGDMAVIIEVNRDFPFQVPLSFDEAAMDVLDWLDECGFTWDMYVDLPENTVRYCFKILEDASAFGQRFVNAPEWRAVAGRH
jgi:hypothetical protein